MKTLILSRFVVLALLFAVFGFASLRSDDRNLTNVAPPVEASGTMQMFNAETVSTNDAARPFFTADFSQKDDDDRDDGALDVIFTDAMRVDSMRERFARPANRIYQTEYKPSLFDTPLFKPNERAMRATLNRAADRRSPNKDAPIKQ